MTFITAGQLDPTKRRLYFHIVGPDGISPVDTEDGEQPQIALNSTDVFDDAGIGTLVLIGSGRYYAVLDQATVADPGTLIQSRYKSDNTAEIPGDSAQITGVDLDLVGQLGATPEQLWTYYQRTLTESNSPVLVLADDDDGEPVGMIKLVKKANFTRKVTIPNVPAGITVEKAFWKISVNLDTPDGDPAQYVLKEITGLVTASGTIVHDGSGDNIAVLQFELGVDDLDDAPVDTQLWSSVKIILSNGKVHSPIKGFVPVRIWNPGIEAIS